MQTGKFLVVLAAALAAGCGRKSEAPGEAPATPAVTVRAASAESRPVWDEEQVVGTVAAAQRTVLSAKVTGVIDAIKVAPGARVKQGDVLATIDAREIRARLDQAAAAQDQAQRDYARVEKLLQSGASTRQESDAATMRLRTADAALSEARTMLQYTSIAAPFDGVVTRKLVEVGDLATPGKPLLEMENASLLRFECEVPEAIVDRVAMGAQFAVGIDAAGADLPGKVTEIAPSASAGSRTFLVKLDLPQNEKLRAGQFGRTRIPVRQRPAVTVPDEAVVRRGQVETVYVLEGGRARLRLVKTGRSVGGQTEILSGLSGGERVAGEGADRLADGVAVEAAP